VIDDMIESWFGADDPVDNTVPIEESKEVIQVPLPSSDITRPIPLSPPGVPYDEINTWEWETPVPNTQIDTDPMGILPTP
jgi:hypothetical protein